MGRPARPLLSRDQIARAALELLDAQGPSGIGMRSLARRLGVQAPSLYNHVASQDDVVDLVHDLVDAEIDVGLLAQPDWRTGFVAFAHSYRTAFLRHPHAVALVTRRPVRSPRALGVYDAFAGMLLRAGLPAGEVMEVAALLDYAVLGSTIDTFMEGFDAAAPRAGAEFPALAQALAAADRDRVDATAFTRALDLLLGDAERRVAAADRAGGG